MDGSCVFHLLGYFVSLRPCLSKLTEPGSAGDLRLGELPRGNSAHLVQNSFTVAKVVGIAHYRLRCLLLGGRATHNPVSTSTVQPGSAISLSSFGVALIACLLCYDGWVQLTFIAGEIRNPTRNVVRALASGTLAVAAIYLLANIAYFRVLSILQIASSQHVGADAAERALGPAGGKVVSLLILISVLGTLNGCFLTSPRVYFAQAADGLFFRKFGEVHPVYGTPGFAILAQALWAAVLLLSGSYESLIDYALFGIWVFYGLMIAAVIVLRRTRPGLARPYRMWVTL